MMALDGKTIIKEEITDKDVYEAAASNNSSRRNKANSSSNSSSGKDSSNSNNSSQTNGCTGASGSSGVSNSSSICTNPNANGARSCRTPDSPESARAIAPRSPMSPQLHHSSLAPPPPRPNRNASASPVVNGATTTTSPPPLPTPPTQAALAAAAAAATAAAVHAEQARLLSKIRKFLGSLVQLAQEIHPEVSDRVRALVLSLVSGGISIDEFRLTLQDAINLPLRPYVIPLLKNHISLLQREISELARASNQTTLQYVTTNENVVMEFSPHGPSAEYSDMFVHMDAAQAAAAAAVAQATASNSAGTTSLVFKRRASDTLMEHHNGIQDWNDYMAAYPPAKRALHAHSAHLSAASADARLAFTSQPTVFDYSAAASSTSAVTQSENNFNSLMEKANHREDRDLRVNIVAENAAQRHPSRVGPPSTSTSGGAASSVNTTLGGEEEWKNIHTMLNCISAMVDKTKRAITILQQRGVEPQQPNYSEVTPASLAEIRRQTEEKVAEFKRNAEEAVNQVKRQAVIEIQRAVVAAETRASEVMSQERLRMEKFFVEMSRHSGGIHNSSTTIAGVAAATVPAERELDNKSPSITAGQNACWNCGRKATETCSGCNLARYCGAFCQHKDWEHHHQICGTTRSSDLSAKHSVSQGIPLTANMRGSISRSPPNQPQSSQSTSQVPQPQNSGSGSVAPPSSLVANGVSSK
ncbi:protein CBFA2T1 [Bactrocera neohumeralis]|uniref:protein CBFA2T1 n=1 Tax=Bactrocera neohumeralis TaxID=98809 RepID=UPI00216696D3|nr:protein CBFA2T1 [Bactrocera neohumeralis]XP_050322532.1 protein CBFA2T1 [Bactrocera neohumeralis]